MAVDKSIWVPLYGELSNDLHSPFFHVFPGQIAMLQAFGFARDKERVDQAELLQPQQACLEMVMFKETVNLPTNTCCPVYKLDNIGSEIIGRELMRRGNCVYSMSRCNNIMLLNIPGSYGFVLNDGAALGNLRIYLRTFSKDEFPWNSKFFIGE